jgi:uncharacterized membrane protein YdbT with pleckstrin-like domain
LRLAAGEARRAWLRAWLLPAAAAVAAAAEVPLLGVVPLLWAGPSAAVLPAAEAASASAASACLGCLAAALPAAAWLQLRPAGEQLEVQRQVRQQQQQQQVALLAFCS